MKAILVIDVDDINRFHADVYKEDDKGNGELVMSYCPLKPMQRKIVNRSTEKDNQYYYDLGFNDCIDEILGEKDESDD